MSINKFTTLLDLSRQAKIITGETATFDGKIEAGIPFSGYPTGVDTGTTVSLGIVSSQDCIFSGNTGTTLFDVSNVSSPNYSSIFSGYTGTTWTNPLFSGGTSGLTLPITTLSADTQIVGPFWTLTQTGYTGEYIIGTQYTGYSITYSFNSVSSILPNITFSGVTTATLENFSAGTLDYKGPLDYLQSVEDATIDGRLYTNKITISNGASASTIGYVLTQTGSNGEGEWLPNSSADTNTYVTGGTLSGTDLILDWNNGGTASPIDLSSLSGGTFTGNTSATCISDIYVSKIHSCSPLEINPLDEGDIVVGSNNNFYFDVTNKSFGIGKIPTLGTLDIEVTHGNFVWRPSLSFNTLSISGGSVQQQQVVVGNENSAFYLAQMGSGFTSNPTIGNSNDSILDSFGANNLNIITRSGTTGTKNIRFYVGSNLTNPSDIHIQGTGTTRGFVGFGTENPTSKVDIIGNINIRNGSTASIYSDLNASGGAFSVSGSTNLPRLGVVAAPYLTKPLAAGSIGMRCWDDVSFDGYGKVGDMHVYASNEANGLNIINSPGANPGVNPTEDYIRFYAGLQADDGTAHIHIQGSGATLGFVGIGTETPDSRLTVNGKTKSTTLQLTSGATNGYVLTSDGSGNATWQLGSTFTGGTVTGPTRFTNGLTATTISATTYQNLPTDIRVTGGTYSNNTFTFTNNTGGTYTTLFNTVTGLTVNGNITITGNTSLKVLTATTIGTSINCVDDIYVSNIHSCSPLLINPLDEGNIIFGSTSGVTINTSDGNITISGSGVPNNKLQIISRGTGAIANKSSFSLYNTTSTSSNEMLFLRYGGTPASPTNITGDMAVMELEGYAYVNSALRHLSTIRTGGVSLSASSYNGYISFLTNTAGGSGPDERMKINSVGNTEIFGSYSSTVPSLSVGPNSEVTFTSQNAGISGTIEFFNSSSASSLSLHNGASSPNRNTTLTQFATYSALVGNSSTAATNNTEMFIVNEGDKSMIFRVNTSQDSLYLLNTGNTLSVFSGTPTSVVYAKNYIDAENIALRAVGTTAFANDIRISANGILTTNTSDERLKENIKPLRGSLNTLLGLSGVTYQWIDRISGGDDERFGFIAQQVESVEPKLVNTNKVDGLKGLKSDCFTPLIVESIKEIYNNPSIPNYTPTNSTDTYGEVGNITTDDNYLYIKTNSGWKRTSLETF